MDKLKQFGKKLKGDKDKDNGDVTPSSVAVAAPAAGAEALQNVSASSVAAAAGGAANATSPPTSKDKQSKDGKKKADLFGFLKKSQRNLGGAGNDDEKDADGIAAAGRSDQLALPASFDAVKLELSGQPTTGSTLEAKGHPPAIAATFRWFRANTRGHFIPLDGVAGPTYKTTIDDVGGRICCQWSPSDPQHFPSNFAECGPIKLDAATETELKSKFHDGTLSAVVAPLRGASDDSLPSRLMLNADSDTVTFDTNSGDTAASFQFNSGIKVRLHESQPAAFVIDSKEGKNAFTAVAESPLDRDIIVLALRSLIDEAEQQRDLIAVTIEVLDANTKRTIAANDDKLKEALTDLVASQQECVSLNQQNRALRAKISTLTTEASSRHQTDKDLEARFAALQAEKDSLAQQLAKSKQHAAALETERNNALDDVEVVKKTLRGVSDQMAAMNSAEGRTKTALDAVQKEGQRLRNELHEATTERNTLRAELESMRSQLKDVESGRRQADDLDERLKRSNQSEAALRSEVTILKQKLEAKEKVEQKLEEVERSNERLQSELHTATSQLQESTDLVAHLKAKAVSEAELRRAAENEAAAKELAQVQQQLASAQQDLVLAKAGQSALEQELQDLKQQMALIRRQNNEKDEKLKELVENRETTNAKLEEQKQQIDELTTQRNFFKRKADSLSQHVEKMLKEMKTGGGAAATPSVSAAAAGSPASSVSAGAAAAAGSGATPSPQPSPSGRQSRSNSASADGWEGESEKARMQYQLSELQKQHKEALGALEAFKKALDVQLAKNKKQGVQNKVLQSTHEQLSHSDTYYAKFVEMQTLANSLAETISDKDTALEHMKRVNKELAKRIRELEAMVVQVGRAPDAAAGAAAGGGGAK